MSYLRPESVDEALRHLQSRTWSLLAGGTDFYPALGDKPVRNSILDLSRLGKLRGIREDAETWRIGALTTWTDVLRADLPPAFDALKLAAREVGSPQIQNVGTVAGNLCNASPAADGVPALLILDAKVELSSLHATRCLPLAEFITGNRQTQRRPDELVTAVVVPKQAATGRSGFLKLGARRYLVISIAMVAARLERGATGECVAAAVAVGACSLVAQRLTALEKALLGSPMDDAQRSLVKPEHFTALSPIDDVRAPAHYRREAARELVKRCLGQCLVVPE